MMKEESTRISVTIDYGDYNFSTPRTTEIAIPTSDLDWMEAIMYFAELLNEQGFVINLKTLKEKVHEASLAQKETTYE